MGWWVYENKEKAQNNNENSNNSSVNQPDEIDSKQTITLASGSVAFQTPRGWANNGVGCIQDAAMFSQETIIDSTALQPESKPKYEKGEDYFNVYACVIVNKRNESPKEWFSRVNAYPSDKDITSSDDINGNKAYYIKFTQEEHGYDDVNYVLSANDKLVYVQARTYENSTSDPIGSGKIGDFRRYEDDIKNIANSVIIK